MPRLTHRVLRSLLQLYPFLNGSGRLIDRTCLKRLHFSESSLAVRTRSGVTIRVAPNDWIGRHLFLTGSFDPTIVAVMRAYAQPGDRMLDIGANIGYVSCELLHSVPELRVVAVEPLPHIYPLLRDNLSQFGARAFAVQAAMSNHSGVATMVIDEENSGASRIVRPEPTPDADQRSVQVDLVTMRDLLERSGLDRVDLIKIDVEGHELQVLESLEETLSLHRPRAVLFEHDSASSSQGNSIERLFARLNYRVEGIRKHLNAWSSHAVGQRGLAGFHDYVASPIDPLTGA